MPDQEIKECIVKMRYGMEIGYGQEIVRCKECKFRQSRVSRIIDGKECNLCEMVKGYKPADWFCADGKHKEGGEVR